MTRTTKTILIALSTTLIASSAFASSGGKGRGFDFDAIDTDGNGTLSQAEFEAQHDARFAKMDSDGNGALSLEELQNMGPKGREGHKNRAEFMLRGLDADNSGDVSPEEMAAMQPEALDFASLDQDGDGELSKKELRKGMKSMHEGKRGGKWGHDDDHDDDDDN